MSKKLFWAQGLIALAALLTLLLLCPSTGYAHRGSWFHIDGPVQLNGKSAPPGTEVTAYIAGSNAGPWKATMFNTGGTLTLWYGVDIPKDSGLPVKDGGVNGDMVRFKVKINGRTYLDPSGEIWQEGMDVVHLINLVTPQLKINDTVLPEATVGLPYLAALQATGGTGPYTWQATNLPAGLSISSDPSDSTKGIISGKPAASPQITAKNTSLAVKVTATDAEGFTAENTFNLTLIWKNGDANGDGEVDMGDVIKVLRIYSGWDLPTPGADPNGDLYVNMLDVTWILDYLFDS